MSCTKLFERGRIGNLELKNRVVMTAMGCSFASSTGEASDEMIRYYADRAKGGCGLIITEITRVDDETGIGTPNQLSVTKEEDIPRLTRLAEAVHAYDTKIFVQLHHPGNQTPARLLHGLQPVSASDVTCQIIGDKPREMTTEEVELMEKKFIKGAVLAKIAGMDGVELHAAHGYLINQFLSPHTNKRTDRFGGDFDRRLTFLTDIIRGIQAMCGPKFPISVRMDGNEYIPDGLTEEDGIRIAKYLEGLGIAALNVSCGTYESGSTIIEPNFFAEGWKKHLAANIKKQVSIPVIAVNTIKHPAFAEQLLEEGVCDFIGVARGQLADAEWANKAKAGKDVLIRKCIGCMECFRILNTGRALECTVNPVLGRELHFGEDKMVKNGNGRTVAVIGAGPAGMEAAVVLAKRGFHTVLFEKDDRLGGTVNQAAVPPHKGMLNEFIETQAAELSEAGVEVRLSTEATVDALKALHPDGIFLAAGGRPIVPSIPGIETAITAEDLLLEKAPSGKKIAVIGGGVTGLETAEWLSESNQVSVIEMMDKVGGNLYPSITMHLVKTITENGGAILKGKKLAAVGDGKVTVCDSKSAEETTLEADLVVLAMGIRADRTMEKELRETFEDRLVLIGDADKPGQILDALHTAYDRAFVFGA
jgi:2,4-dienoyl-CoA reductase-like NADH-dependent reductase (Old Yellow Enzyme family)/thioredoxin reductase